MSDDEYKEFGKIWSSSDIDFTRPLDDIEDPSNKSKTWQERMHENYADGGDITDFFHDLAGAELAPNLSPSNLAGIYCFFQVLREFPELLGEVDPGTWEDVAYLEEELLQRMDHMKLAR